jgi:GTP-binding protein
MGGDPGAGRGPLEDLASLRRELSLYDATLEDRPWLVVANKMDLPEAAENLAIFQARHPRLVTFPISAESGMGLDALREALRERLAIAAR